MKSSQLLRIIKYTCFLLGYFLCLPYSSAGSNHQAKSYQYFLPIIKTPLPPPITESRYLIVTNTNSFDGYGCKQGESMQVGQEGVSVLLFGNPAYDVVREIYGTFLLGDNATFASTVNISRSAELWIEGFWRCNTTKNTKIILAIGTGNYGLGTNTGIDIDREHAKTWAMMVNDINLGAITQKQACIDHPKDDCTGTDNQPQQAWKQLWDTLNKDPKTAQDPPMLTDLRWEY